MKKNRRLRCAFFAAAAAVLLTGCRAGTGRTLKVGVKDDVANFGLYDSESGRYSGMEIDLAQMIGEELGYSDLELTTVSAATREEMLDSGKVDMVIATCSITEDRQENYDFSAPYYTDYVAVMAEESSMIGDIEDLKGCSVGVMKNTSNPLSLADYMEQKGIISEFDRDNFTAASYDGELTFVEYDSYNDVSRALEYGDVDAFIADRSILGGYKGDDRTVLPDEFAPQDYGVCLKKGSGLTEKVNEALQKWTDDGTLQQLIDKWGN